MPDDDIQEIKKSEHKTNVHIQTNTQDNLQNQNRHRDNLNRTVQDTSNVNSGVSRQSDLSRALNQNINLISQENIRHEERAANLPGRPQYVGIEKVYATVQKNDGFFMKRIRKALAHYHECVDNGDDEVAALDGIIKACKYFKYLGFAFFEGISGVKKFLEVKQLIKEAEYKKERIKVVKAVGEDNLHEGIWMTNGDNNRRLQNEIREKLRVTQQRSAGEKEALRHKKIYKIKNLSKKSRENNTRYITGSQKVKSIRDAIKEVMPNAYGEMDNALMSNRKEDEKEFELVHSEGSKYIDQGHNVIEFDVAGSGFDQFRKEHEGIHGMVKDDKGNMYEALQNKMDDKGYLWKGEKSYQKEYNGEQVTCNKTRYSLAGPWMLNNNKLSDYSIQATRKRIRDIGASMLERTFSEWRRKEEEGKKVIYQPVDIMLRGHSRGGVAASHGAMMLKYWVQQNYPEYMEYVHFDLIQYDPVPGYDVEFMEGKSDAMERFDVKNYQGINKGSFTIDGEKMVPLEDISGTTVIYSMVNQDDAKHKMLFSPQEVLHARRLILMPFTHDIGLDLRHIDTSQVNEGNDKAHAMAFYDEKSKKVYRSSGLNELDDGVYVVDENHVMVKVDSLAQLKNILMRTMPDTYKTRRERILRAAASVFGEKSEENPYSAIDYKRTSKLCEKIIKDNRSPGRTRAQVQRYLTDIRQLMTNRLFPVRKEDGKDIIKKYELAIQSISLYISENDNGKLTEAGRNRRDNMKLLYISLVREKRHLEEQIRTANFDSFKTWQEIFFRETELDREEVDISSINDQMGEAYRIEKNGGVSYFKEMNEADVSSACALSYLMEHMGFQGYFRAVNRATLKGDDKNQEKKGIVYEQSYDITYEQAFDKSGIYSKTSTPTVEDSVKKKLDMIKAVDILFGIDQRLEGDMKTIKVRVQRHQDDKTGEIAKSGQDLSTIKDTYDIIDVCAEPITSPIFTGGAEADYKLNDLEKAAIKELSGEAKEFLKKLKIKDLSVMMKGACNDSCIGKIEKRLREIQKGLG